MTRCFTPMIALAAALSFTGCGSSSPAEPTTHTLPSTVMIMSTGVTPAEVTVAVGDRVNFMNHDSVTHSVAGGADPTRPDCPEINAVGVLAPGDIRPTAPFTTAKTCQYHNPRMQSALFTGRIVVR
jgi:plastocyanin